MNNTHQSAVGKRVMPQVVREGLPNEVRHKLHLKRKGFNSTGRTQRAWLDRGAQRCIGSSTRSIGNWLVCLAGMDEWVVRESTGYKAGRRLQFSFKELMLKSRG